MHWLLYVRLIVLTAGTLLPFFWMVVILGHRRQRNFERVFFFLCLALTGFFGSSLLALNAQLFYGSTPPGLLRFAWAFVCLGLWFLPPLVLHLHVEYASLRGLFPSKGRNYFWLGFAWLPTMLGVGFLFRAIRLREGIDFEHPTHLFGLFFQIWLAAAMVVAAYWQHRFLKVAPDAEQKTFHQIMEVLLCVVAALLFQIAVSQHFFPGAGMESTAVLMILALLPLGILIGKVQRFNFLQIGRQRNLVYAVFAVFLALLYLSFVRRAGLWLESYLPPEATAALLLFLPVVFFEPLQRFIRRLLRQTAQSEVDRAQKLMGPINEVARLGDLEKLRQFGESWIVEQLQLGEVHLSLDEGGAAPRRADAGRASSEERFEIHRGRRHIGTLEVRSHGAMISGETYAALEFVAEQLPAAFDLCRLIEEKLQLEREMAERERLVLVGQMAASISHNLKNPLGSIKTILQVQMESPDLPDSLRTETQMVLDEINRLSAKLNQLLQFSRPGVRDGASQDRCDLARIAEEVIGVFLHEAERRGVSLKMEAEPNALKVAASPEAANDILSNMVLNALEAAPEGGHVNLQLGSSDRICLVSVEDDGPGVPPGLSEKILQPFFTTKARGTGLGLAIVSKRLEEVGGALSWKSPIQNGRGTRFALSFPLASQTEKARVPK
jgi:signal transduction histidine kinase